MVGVDAAPSRARRRGGAGRSLGHPSATTSRTPWTFPRQVGEVQFVVVSRGGAVLAMLGSLSAPLLAVATGTNAPLPAMLRRGGLLAAGDTIRTALSVVRTGLGCGACKLLGLAAREPGAEPQAPPQPFARLPGKPHRCLLLCRPRSTLFKKAGANRPISSLEKPRLSGTLPLYQKTLLS